jgi:amino acid transporter
MSETLNANPNTPMVRALGFWSLWAIGVGAVVGDGVFLYSAAGIAAGGPSAMLAFVFAGLIQMAIMVAMCELSIGMPTAGGPTVWVVKYVGRFWGLMSGLAFSVGYMILGGSVSVAMGRFISYWTPGIEQEFATILWAFVFFTLFLIMNIVGVEFMGKGQLALCLILVGIMLVFGIGGLLRGAVDFDNFEPFMPYGMGGMTAVIPIATYAFMGASCICFAGEECKRPKDLARALVWSSITFIVVYTLALFVVLGSTHYSEVASYDMSPFVRASEIIFGPAGAWIVNLAAVIAAGTCLLTGCLYMPSRLLYSMSVRGYMPKVFGKLNPKTKVPVHGLLICWGVGVAGIFIAANAGAMAFYGFMCNQAVIAWIISWSLSIVAGIRYRNEMGKERLQAQINWTQPFFPVIPIVALAGCLYCIYLSFFDIWQVVGLAAWVSVYAVYYWRVQLKVKAGLISEDLGFLGDKTE